jgi:hypothetical protein
MLPQQHRREVDPPIQVETCRAIRESAPGMGAPLPGFAGHGHRC